MIVKFTEACVDVLPLPVSSVIKCNLFAMAKQLCVQSSILAF